MACAGLPEEKHFILWANAALQEVNTVSELSVRIVDEAESAKLNKKWRNKSGPTNVLSFPAEVAEEVLPRLLGDIVVCAPVIARVSRSRHIGHIWLFMAHYIY